MRFFDRLNFIFKSIIRITEYLSAIAVFLMMTITVIDVFMRYLLKRPIMGAPELTEFLMVISIFLLWALCAVERKHVGVDILTSHFSKRKQTLLELIMLLIVFPFFLIMAREGFYETFHQKSVSTVLRIPRAPFYGVMAFGVALLALAMLKLIIEDLLALRRKSEP